MSTRTISIFDTTLRDGDQGTGTPFMLPEKILVARKLAEAGMNVIEAGFARSRVDSGSIRSVVSEIGIWANAPTIASLSRAGKEDIDASYQALREATHPRIHTFIATSPLHMEKKLRMSPEQVLEAIRSSVSYAVSTGMEVQWSAEDAANSEWKFLKEAVIVAIESWARVINIPDTLWGSNPWHMENLFAFLTKETEYLRREWRDFIFSVHPHNDNGLALANTLAAIRGGAQQVESTVLGIGERTGNLSMHQIVAYLKESGWTLIPGAQLVTTVRESSVFPVSHLVSRILGMEIRPNEPIIGSRTNSHGSWIHADGAIKWKSVAWVDPYSIIDTSRYGTPPEEKTFNARSGAAEVLEMLSRFIEVDNLVKSDVDWITTKATAMAERARWVYPSYLYTLYLEEAKKFSIESIEISTSHTVEITLLVNGEKIRLQGESDSENGVISATMSAINGFLGKGNEFDVVHFSAEDRLSAWDLAEKFLGEGSQAARAYGGEAVGIVTFELEDWQGNKVHTRYACKNVEEASVRAIIYGVAPRLYSHIEYGTKA